MGARGDGANRDFVGCFVIFGQRAARLLFAVYENVDFERCGWLVGELHIDLKRARGHHVEGHVCGWTSRSGAAAPIDLYCEVGVRLGRLAFRRRVADAALREAVCVVWAVVCFTRLATLSVVSFIVPIVTDSQKNALQNGAFSVCEQVEAALCPFGRVADVERVEIGLVYGGGAGFLRGAVVDRRLIPQGEERKLRLTDLCPVFRCGRGGAPAVVAFDAHMDVQSYFVCANDRGDGPAAFQLDLVVAPVARELDALFPVRLGCA